MMFGGYEYGMWRHSLRAPYRHRSSDSKFARLVICRKNNAARTCAYNQRFTAEFGVI
jgi:hypothetical protein